MHAETQATIGACDDVLAADQVRIANDPVRDQFGVFELLTLPEPHQIRVAAPGYKTVIVGVGRVWFLWLPRGLEKHDIVLLPE